jgi:integrase
MARGIYKLTVAQIGKAKREGKTVPDGGGLYLQRGSAWVFRYTRNGNTHYAGLGPLALVDLATAREAALACRKQLFAGIDPLESRHQQRIEAALKAATAMTFDACAAAYVAAHGDSWKNPKHKQQWSNTLRDYASPVIGKLQVASIDVPSVLRVLEPIWREKSVTADRLRGRIERVLGWAGVKGFRDNAIPNPAAWKNNLDHLLPAKGAIREVVHHAALPYAEIAPFMVELRKEQGVAARALEFTIFTAVRTGDIIGQASENAPPMRWEHVDLDARLWTIPKTKNGSEHRVPLSAPAIALLENIKPFADGSGIVFPGDRRGRPLSNTTMRRVLHRIGRPDLTVHGFRACFKT